MAEDPKPVEESAIGETEEAKDAVVTKPSPEEEETAIETNGDAKDPSADDEAKDTKDNKEDPAESQEAQEQPETPDASQQEPPPKEPELSPEPAVVPQPPKSSFHTVDEKSRAETHGKLRAYEAKRRSAYTSKLESSSLYWRSFRDLLHASVHETARAERLVLGSAKANQIYANAMQATYDDVYLDDKGHVVTDPRKQKRLGELRHSQDYTISTNDHTTKKEEERRVGMLSSLIDSQAVLAERFGENAKHVSTEIASELTGLRAELQTQVQGIERLGNAIVSELETAESEVKNSWDSYYSMAVKSMGAGVAPLNLSRRTSSSAEDKAGVEKISDVWVVEMQYRVAVAYQSMAWEKGSAELSKLFASMKEAECERRVKLREVLIAFLNRQERLFLSLPSVQTPVLKDLVGRQMDPDTIEENVQVSIRKRAQFLQMQEKNSPVKKSGPGLSAVDEADADFKLESPLTSELLCKAKVIERKTTGMMSSWKTTLAVVTADAFLHLFDLPNNKVNSGSAAEVAFQSLVPTVAVPTADTIKASGKTPSFLKGWSEHLVPSESVVLSNCTITMGSDTNFEVVETVHNTGASKMFGKVSTRKLLLRAVTRDESQDWIDTLKAQQFAR